MSNSRQTHSQSEGQATTHVQVRVLGHALLSREHLHSWGVAMFCTVLPASTCPSSLCDAHAPYYTSHPLYRKRQTRGRGVDALSFLTLMQPGMKRGLRAQHRPVARPETKRQIRQTPALTEVTSQHFLMFYGSRAAWLPNEYINGRRTAFLTTYSRSFVGCAVTKAGSLILSHLIPNSSGLISDVSFAATRLTLTMPSSSH